MGEPLGSAEPRLKNTALDSTSNRILILFNVCNYLEQSSNQFSNVCPFVKVYLDVGQSYLTYVHLFCRVAKVGTFYGAEKKRKKVRNGNLSFRFETSFMTKK